VAAQTAVILPLRGTMLLKSVKMHFPERFRRRKLRRIFSAKPPRKVGHYKFSLGFNCAFPRLLLPILLILFDSVKWTTLGLIAELHYTITG
jgi:hypothetical protein